MIPLIEQHRPQIEALCRQHHVARLELFGSAATDRFDPAASDLDFLVEFQPLDAAARTDAYFALLESLRDLLGRDVDLVVEHAIENRYFRQAVNRSRQVLYAA